MVLTNEQMNGVTPGYADGVCKGLGFWGGEKRKDAVFLEHPKLCKNRPVVDSFLSCCVQSPTQCSPYRQGAEVPRGEVTHPARCPGRSDPPPHSGHNEDVKYPEAPGGAHPCLLHP